MVGRGPIPAGIGPQPGGLLMRDPCGIRMRVPAVWAMVPGCSFWELPVAYCNIMGECLRISLFICNISNVLAIL